MSARCADWPATRSTAITRRAAGSCRSGFSRDLKSARVNDSTIAAQAAPTKSDPHHASGDAKAGDAADRIGVEAGQRGEVAAALDVIAIRTEAWRPRGEQHHALAVQRALGLPDRIGEIDSGGEPEPPLCRQRRQ